MRVAVLGVGLIGGSVGLAARRAGARVTGYDSNPAVGRAALGLGAIDELATDIATAVSDAEVVFAATPVGTLHDVVSEALELAPADCVVSDVGSTKRVVVAAGADPRFVGGHPLAGAETAGVQNARKNLFEDATWYLTRRPETSQRLYERLRDLLECFGAHPFVIDPETHDHLMASISHMPHILANVLVEQATATGAQRIGRTLPATGPSFRDATRVAGANSEIWTDIYLSNRDALITGIDETRRRLADIRALLEAGDPELVTAWNERVRAQRDDLLAAGLATSHPHELRVSVPNNPGVVADIAREVVQASVNIDEMSVSPSENHIWGVVVLLVHGDEHARRAEDLIVNKLGLTVTRA